MSVSLFAKYDNCYFVASDLRNEIIEKMINKASELSKESNIDNIEVIVLTNRIVNVGRREFERLFKQRFAEDKDVKDLVNLIIVTNQQHFSTEFYASEILQKTLKGEQL